MSKLFHAIYLSIIAALSMALIYPSATNEGQKGPQPDDTRVVILPFVAHDYFSDEVAAAFLPMLLHSLESTPNLSVVPLTEIPADSRELDEYHTWPGDTESYVALKLEVFGRSDSLRISGLMLDGFTGERHELTISGSGGPSIHESIADKVTDHVVALSTRSLLEPS